MAKLEIPSIIVHNGSNSAPSSPKMERSRSLRSQRMLSKQDEFEEVEDEVPPLEGEQVWTPRESKEQDAALEEGKGAEDGTQKGEEPDAPAGQSGDNKDDDKQAPLPSPRSHAKVRLLVRSHAMREAMSPPPEPDPAPPQPSPLQASPAATPNSLTTPSQGRSSSRHSLRHQGSSGGSGESSSPCLSRESSTEQPYTDSKGIDLQQFLLGTVHRNQKDRLVILKVEAELIAFVKDNAKSHHKFPAMSSYQRMLVHRLAAYFGLDHNIDATGNAVIVSKTKNTRLPSFLFRDHARSDELFPEEPKKSILKRDSSSFEEGSNFKSPERQLSSESRRSKSFEEREEEYERARKRIFNQDSSSSQEGVVDSPHRSQESTHNSSRRSSQEELRWSGDIRLWSSSDSDGSSRVKLPAGKSLDTDNQPTRLLKVESFESRDSKPSSLRPAVSKSYSFGGYTGGVSVLCRGDSITSTHSAGARLFTKQDSSSSNTSRLSPSSSGYKSHSQRSDNSATASTTPSPTPSSQLSLSGHLQQQSHSSSQVTLAMGESFSPGEPVLGGQPIMWAVSNLDSVPPGSILINPQTGQPYANADGSLYRFDPGNPPKFASIAPTASSHTASSTSTQNVPLISHSHLPAAESIAPVPPQHPPNPPPPPQPQLQQTPHSQPYSQPVMLQHAPPDPHPPPNLPSMQVPPPPIRTHIQHPPPPQPPPDTQFQSASYPPPPVLVPMGSNMEGMMGNQSQTTYQYQPASSNVAMPTPIVYQMQPSLSVAGSQPERQQATMDPNMMVTNLSGYFSNMNLNPEVVVEPVASDTFPNSTAQSGSQQYAASMPSFQTGQSQLNAMPVTFCFVPPINSVNQPGVQLVYPPYVQSQAPQSTPSVTTEIQAQEGQGQEGRVTVPVQSVIRTYPGINFSVPVIHASGGSEGTSQPVYVVSAPGAVPILPPTSTAGADTSLSQAPTYTYPASHVPAPNYAYPATPPLPPSIPPPPLPAQPMAYAAAPHGLTMPTQLGSNPASGRP